MSDVDVAVLLDPEVATAVAGFRAGLATGENLAASRARGWSCMAPYEPSGAVELTERVIDEATGVRVRVHRPVAPASGLRPAVYAIHGGGYVTGQAATEDPRLDRWCRRFDCVGVAVEYRLAPEHPYPTPLEDCYAGLRWLHEHAAELGVDPGRVGIAGGSAGGGLAAALALLARDRGELPVAFQLLSCPMLDDRQITPSSRWDVPVWDPGSNTFGWRSYLGPLHGGDVPAYAAPARATDLRGLPPALITVGSVDRFVDEDVTYAQRLLQAGVPTELHVFPGGCHGFEVFAPQSAIARRSVRTTEEWLAARLGVEPAA